MQRFDAVVIVPGQGHLPAAADERREDGPLQEVAAAGGGVVEDGEGAAAVVARPDELLALVEVVRVAGDGAQDVVVAVVVEVGDEGQLVERPADGVALPVATGRAGVAIPPRAGDDIGAVVAVQVGRVDEHRPPRPRRVYEVGLPFFQRLTLRRRLVRLVDPDVQPRRVPDERLAEDVQVAVAVQVAQTGFVVAGAGVHGMKREVTRAVAQQQHRARRGVGRIAAHKFPHLAQEDVEVAVAVDVADVERVGVEN